MTSPNGEDEKVTSNGQTTTDGNHKTDENRVPENGDRDGNPECNATESRSKVSKYHLQPELIQKKADPVSRSFIIYCAMVNL